MPNRVVIYGGRGGLGSTLVKHFKSKGKFDSTLNYNVVEYFLIGFSVILCIHFLNIKGWWVCSIDLAANDEADVNVLVNPKDEWLVQELAVTEAVQKHLGGQKLDSVLNMAGNFQVQSTLSLVYFQL